MEFSKRLDLFGDEIFSALNQRKVALEAQGRTLFNLSVGTPDFEAPAHVKQALMDAAKNQDNWKYSLRDLPELLDAVCSYYQRRFGVAITPDQVMSVNGSQEGMGHLGLALCDEGSTVLLPDPGYPVFTAGAKLGGATPWYYPLSAEKGFLPDFDAIPDEVADRAKYMVVSLPANPVGSVARPGFYEELVAYGKAHDLLIVHDNAYSDIIFDGNVGRSFFNTPGAEEVGVEFFSLSKSFNVTGARISFLVGRRDVVAALRKLQPDRLRYVPAGSVCGHCGPHRPAGQREGPVRRLSGPAGRPVRRSALHRLERAGQPRQYVRVGAAARPLHQEHGLLHGPDRQSRGHLHPRPELRAPRRGVCALCAGASARAHCPGRGSHPGERPGGAALTFLLKRKTAGSVFHKH